MCVCVCLRVSVCVGVGGLELLSPRFSAIYLIFALASILMCFVVVTTTEIKNWKKRIITNDDSSAEYCVN